MVLVGCALRNIGVDEILLCAQNDGSDGNGKSNSNGNGNGV
jgi:hypothetical protein